MVISRSVAWPTQQALVAVARSLEAQAASSHLGWFWLDASGLQISATVDQHRSYLGLAAEVRECAAGREREFLRELRATNVQTATTEIAGQGVLPREGLNEGWVVAFAYEFGVALMNLNAETDQSAEATAIAFRSEVMLVLDHATGRAELVGPSETAIDVWISQHGAALALKGVDPTCENLEHISRATGRKQSEEDSWRRSSEQYLDDVVTCREHIAEGDAYVLCLTDTAQRSCSRDPLDLYLDLRESGAATRGGILATGDRVLVSASPEKFLSVRGSAIVTHPIKGTRRRGGTPAEDNRMRADLVADEKERAENLMIVDLMRNDLARVCETGSVRVDGFLRVETHPHVHQLVSTVQGKLRAEASVFDALEACFPGGSMTGAPKRRAMRLLAEIEQAPRGLYSGCFGWIDDRGDAELAMTIRSIELRAETAGAWQALIGAGGGVTAESDPESELAEKHLKAAPLLAAVRTG